MSSNETAQQVKWWNGGRSPFNLEYGKLMMWYFLMSDAFTFGAFLISYGTIRFSQNFWADPNVVFNAFPGAGHANLPLAFVSVMTFILIISSVTMVLAVHAGHNGNRNGVIKWMLWTILGGVAFLLCQAWEWHHLITGAHPVLADGKIELLGQTMGGNPWGRLVDPADAQHALAASSHETLVHLAEEYPKAGTVPNLAQLEKMNVQQLAGMVDMEHAHIREKGPIAFGGYFFGITGFHGFHVFSGVIINIVMLIMTSKGVFDRRGHYLMIEKAGLYWHFVDLVWVFVFLCFYLI